MRGRRLAAAGVLLAAACGAEPPARVGVLLWGEWGVEATRVAQDVLASRPDPPPITFIVDSQPPATGPQVALSTQWVEASEAMIRRPGVVAVVGHTGSRESLVAAPAHNDGRVPLLVPTGTSRTLHVAGPWIFALPPDERAEAGYLVRVAARRFGAHTITIFQYNDEYGVGLGNAVAEAAAVVGLRVVDRVLVGSSPEDDYDALVGASLRRGAPDVAVVAGRPWAVVGVAAALRRRGLAIPVLAGDGADAPTTLRLAGGDTLPEVYIATFWRPVPDDAASVHFTERFQRIVGRPPNAAHALTYDALMLLATAVDEGARTPAEVRAWLASLGRTHPPVRGITGLLGFGQDRSASFVLVSTRDLARALP